VLIKQIYNHTLSDHRQKHCPL